MSHRLHTTLSIAGALVVLACAGCSLKRINARTFTLTSTLTIGIGDLAPGCHFTDGDGPSALPVRSSVHFTADVRNENEVVATPPARGTCERDRHAHHAVKVD